MLKVKKTVKNVRAKVITKTCKLPLRKTVKDVR